MISRRTLLAATIALAAGRSIARVATVPTLLASATGAKGDGRTDDSAPLLAALNSGHVLDGRGATFAVAGNLKVGAAFAGMANLTLRQLDPAAPDRRTLLIGGARDFRIENVTVLRGGTGAEHPDRALMNDNCGVFIHGCRDFHLTAVTVAGGGIGTGLAIYDSEDFTLDGCRAHDMLWLLDRMPRDDAIQGILFGRCRRFQARSPAADDIGGRVGGVISHDQNRGIAVTGCSDFTISDAAVRNVGQGLDVSGGDGNLRFRIVRGLISDVATWGYKFANSAQAGLVTDAVAVRCGIGGFVASGPSQAGIRTPTGTIVFDRCSARDMVCNYNSGRSFGFGTLVVPQFDPASPNGIVFRDCSAAGRPGARMLYGFDNEVVGITDPAKRNRVENCTATGFVRAAINGFS